MIKVLRLGHRSGRDDRISTHVGLVARQWGASGIVYSGERDAGMMDSLEDIVERWGGPFTVEYEEEWRSVINGFDGLKIHLTMYGESIDGVMEDVKDAADDRDLLVIVGAEKVPRAVYKLSDYNVSVGNQPHSEIAALAVLLDRLTDIKDEFDDADIEVEPSKDQKLTREKDGQ